MKDLRSFVVLGGLIVGRIVDVKFLVCFVDGFRLVGRGSSKNCYFGLDLD